MIYYKVIHLFFTKQADHIHCFDIGIYDSKTLAMDVVERTTGRLGLIGWEDAETTYVEKLGKIVVGL